MKYLFYSLAILTLVSCSKLEEFSATYSTTHCSSSIVINGYDDNGNLIVSCCAGAMDNAKFWGDIVFRNDSLILIAKNNYPSARSTRRYRLTYIISDIDTCGLKIGFEKDYANFVKRPLKKIKKLSSTYDSNMSEKDRKKYSKRMRILYIKTTTKSWKERKSYRDQIKFYENKKKIPDRVLDDVYL